MDASAAVVEERERESATGSSVRDGVPVETKAEASWWTGPVALLAAH